MIDRLIKLFRLQPRHVPNYELKKLAPLGLNGLKELKGWKKRHLLDDECRDCIDYFVEEVWIYRKYLK